MFVRKKRNQSGIISIQVIDKSSGKYKVLKTIGSSADILEVERFLKDGQHWIKQHSKQTEIDLLGDQEMFDKFISNIR